MPLERTYRTGAIPRRSGARTANFKQRELSRDPSLAFKPEHCFLPVRLRGLIDLPALSNAVGAFLQEQAFGPANVFGTAPKINVLEVKGKNRTERLDNARLVARCLKEQPTSPHWPSYQPGLQLIRVAKDDHIVVSISSPVALVDITKSWLWSRIGSHYANAGSGPSLSKRDKYDRHFSSRDSTGSDSLHKDSLVVDYSTSSSSTVRHKLPHSVARALSEYRCKTTIPAEATLLAGLSFLLFRLTGHELITIGLLEPGCLQKRTHELSYNSTSAVTLQIPVSDSLTCRDLAQSSYAELQAASDQMGSKTNPADLDTSSRNAPTHAPRVSVRCSTASAKWTEDLTAFPLDWDMDMPECELGFSFEITNSSVDCEVTYSHPTYEPEFVDHLIRRIGSFARQATANPSRTLGSVNTLLPGEQRVLMKQSRGPRRRAPAMTLAVAVERAAERSPDAEAVRMTEESITYGDLNRRANRLAHFLVDHGIRAEDRVGVAVRRSISMIVTIVAIAKAHACHVPLDIEYPATRLSFMLSDAQPKLVLTTADCLSKMPTSCNCFLLDTEESQIELSRYGPSACPQLNRYRRRLHHTIYLIYTSGSTGIPKGVLVTNAGVGSLALSQVERLEVTSHSRVLQLASTSFDASFFEMLMAFAAGATLVIASDDERCGDGLAEAMARCGITHATLPPAVASTIPDDAHIPLHTLILAGEQCPEHLVRRWAPTTRVINAYGPTETTVCATMSTPLTAGDIPPIGTPIINTDVYILDKNLRPVPTGFPGDLYVGGRSVARGYLNQPTLTKERFIASPFSRSRPRLYRTGDLAARRSDGNLVFLGRSDDEVKIRGFRVHPLEVEAAIKRCAGVREAAVIPRWNSARTASLIAYVVPTQFGQPTSAGLVDQLRQTLPGYMVPAQIVLVVALPRTHNGKIDVRNLPEAQVFAARVNGTTIPDEQSLLALLSDTLGGCPGLTATDDFFHMGGDSLLAAQVVTAIRATYGVKLRLHQLYEHPTARALGRLVHSYTRQLNHAGATASQSPALETLVLLQHCAALTEPEAKSILNSFPIVAPCDSRLLIGRKFRWEPEVICGGPCIENDLAGISMNTFLQILIPLRVASEYNCPAAVYIPVMEEMLRHPHAATAFLQLGTRIERAVRRLAAAFSVEVVMLNTANDRVNSIIHSVRANLPVRLSPRQSRNLYGDCADSCDANLESRRIRHVYERFVACHTATALSQMTGRKQILIVEDTEQTNAVTIASLFEDNEQVDLLGFIPCPGLHAPGPMFRSKPESRLLLNRPGVNLQGRLASAPQIVGQYFELASELQPPGCSSGIDALLTYAQSVLYHRTIGPFARMGV
jgi:amino acid adenylation domain-containing protein